MTTLERPRPAPVGRLVDQFERGLDALAIAVAVELNRSAPLLDIRWLVSPAMLHLTATLFLFRLILSDQSAGAPRMFQVLVVEAADEDRLAMAGWAFPAYLFAMSLTADGNAVRAANPRPRRGGPTRAPQQNTNRRARTR